MNQPVEAPNLLDFDEPAPLPSNDLPPDLVDAPPQPPAQAPTAPLAETNSSGSFFGGMSAKASVSIQTAPEVYNDVDNDIDLFGTTKESHIAITEAKDTSVSLFDDMVLKSSDNGKENIEVSSKLQYGRMNDQ